MEGAHFELPCDWTVNRRPAPCSSSNAAGSAPTAQKEEEASLLLSPQPPQQGDAQGGTRRVRKKPKPGPQPTTMTTGVTLPKEDDEPPPSAAAAAPDVAPAPAAAETSAGSIQPHPLGPLTYPVAPPPSNHSILGAPKTSASSSSGGLGVPNRIKNMILKQLMRQPQAGGEPNQPDGDGDGGEEMIDTESLLSRLPYRKMLSDMFGGSLRGSLRNPSIPYVTRAYEEAFMREPMHSSERECANGKRCECMFIDRAQPFIGVEFLLPGEVLPRTPHLCVLCCRATTQQLYYDVMFDRTDFSGTIQRFGNIHSQPGEYALDAMLIAMPNAPVHIMPLPIVSHQRNRYTVYVAGGIKRLRQSRIESTLQELHARQRTHGDVQHEIDARLVACISADLRELILPRNHVPHYDNLPDISAYAIGILDPSMDSDAELQQVLLLLRQCTPLRRRTKRAQREVQWREESLVPMQTLVRCLQGTLLGLYPNCLKSIAFGARLGLLRFIRTLLVQPFARLHACMQRIPYIIKLGVMEHLCNTIYDYHPGICHTLNRSGQKMEHFCNSVSTICDIFRGELNTLYCAAAHSSMGFPAKDMETILTILPRLEKIAHSYFERCTRAYRGIIVGGVQPLHSIDYARRMLMPEERGLMERILDRSFAAYNHSVFDTAHASIFAEARTRELAWHVTQIVQVHPLPAAIIQRQYEALLRRYSGDTTCVARCRTLHLCMQCIVRKGSVQGTRLRHDCLSGALICMHCGSGTVLTIDMLGRIMTVGGEHLLLSSCCGSFVYYGGNGHEFITKCGVQCACAQQLYRKRDRSAGGRNNNNHHSNNNNNGAVAPAATGGASCLVCFQRNAIQQSIQLLDVFTRRMVTYALCSKHVVPHHIMRGLHDKDMILRFFQQQKQRPPKGASRFH